MNKQHQSSMQWLPAFLLALFLAGGRLSASSATSDEEHRFTELASHERMHELTELASSYIKANPRDDLAYFFRSYAEACDKRTWDQALKDIDKALEVKPNDGRCFWWKAQILHYQQEDEEALPLVDKACSLLPKFPSALCTRAEILCTLKRYPEALKSIDAAIEIIPHQDTGHFIKAKILEKLSRWEECERQLDETLKLNATNGFARYERVQACLRLKNWTKVIDDTTYLILHDRRHRVRALDKRAFAFVQLKDYKSAIADLKQAVSLADQDRTLHKELARVYALSGDAKAAEAEKQWLKQMDEDIRPL